MCLETGQELVNKSQTCNASDSLKSTGVCFVLHGEEGCSAMSLVLTVQTAVDLFRHNARGSTELKHTNQPKIL